MTVYQVGPTASSRVPLFAGSGRLARTLAAWVLTLSAALNSTLLWSQTLLPDAPPNAVTKPRTEPAGATHPEHSPGPGFIAYQQGRLDRAVVIFSESARRGDPIAQYNLAVIRLRGESKAIGLQRAIRYLKDSASRGFAPAQYMLATWYENGQYLNKSLPAAVTWYRRAAEQGVVDAQLALAIGYYLGRGTARDFSQAAHWYEQAANGGDVAAQYLIASMYETGLGVPRDLPGALTWYSAAARQGDPAAPGKAKEIADMIARERNQ